MSPLEGIVNILMRYWNRMELIPALKETKRKICREYLNVFYRNLSLFTVVRTLPLTKNGFTQAQRWMTVYDGSFRTSFAWFPTRIDFIYCSVHCLALIKNISLQAFIELLCVDSQTEGNITAGIIFNHGWKQIADSCDWWRNPISTCISIFQRIDIVPNCE